MENEPEDYGSKDDDQFCLVHPQGVSLNFKGGAGAGYKAKWIQEMVSIAIENASWHGITLNAGRPNNADGNCIFEAVVDHINDRSCFNEQITESVDLLRKIWLTEAEALVFNFTTGLGRPVSQFVEEWNHLKMSRTYASDLGDFVLPAVAHCTQKDILIFNGDECLNPDPVYVIEASRLGNRQANTDIPVVLAYNGTHYESLLPYTESDTQKSVSLKRQVLNNEYSIKKGDIPVFKPFLKQNHEENDASLKNLHGNSTLFKYH